MSTKHPTSPTKPSPTSNVRPNRLPAPTLFVGPPSRNASQLSVSRQGLSATNSKSRDPLNRQSSLLGKQSNSNGGSPKDTALSSVKKASEREAETKWREMQSTLNEVELTAQSSTHVFGESHAAALEELRRAQVELARAWGRGNEDKDRHEKDHSEPEVQQSRFGGADSIAQDRVQRQRQRGGTDASASTVLSDESVLTASTKSGTGRSTLEDETAQDIKLASERRAANEAYFKKVEMGVKDVVAKLEVVAEAMRGVEGESRSLWSQSTRSWEGSDAGRKTTAADG